MNSLYSIEKLDEQNYYAWCIQMKSVLIHSGLWKVVSTKDVKAEEFQVQDEKALATLILCVKASQLNHIKSCKTSAEAWKRLEEVHRPSGPVRKVSLYKKLLNLRMADGENMQQFLNEFSNCVDKLSEVGITIQSELVVIILLSCLPKSYEQFVVAMETRDSLPSFDILKVKLLEEGERKVQNSTTENSSEAQAYMVKSRKFNSTNNGARSSRTSKAKNFKCFSCGRRGHYAANCNSKKENNNKAEVNHTVLAAADINVLRKVDWCLDSGVTSHMCCEKSFFVNLREHKENVYLAGEQHWTTAGKGRSWVWIRQVIRSSRLKEKCTYIMVGYSLTAKAYRIYDQEKRAVVEKRDVMFIDKQVPKKNSQDNEKNGLVDTVDLLVCPQEESQVMDDSMAIQEEFVGFEESDSEEGGFEECKAEEGEELHHAMIKERRRLLRDKVAKKDITIPQSVREALSGEHSKEWMQYMRSEYDALLNNRTWSLVEKPAGKNPIGCKWVFTVKKNKSGEIEKFKSRLVAKGCSQKYGLDYTETFSPVIRYETIRMVLALAVEKKMYLHQMDVCTANLNSELTEEVYMKQPEMFVSKQYPDRVLKLHKAIYGLKQSGRAWNSKLDEVLKKAGFTPCVNDPCLYKKMTRGKLSLIAVYVDDLIIGSQDKKTMYEIKEYICDNFECVDKGPLEHFLGIRIEREGDLGAIAIDQSQLINELLRSHKMEVCKPPSTPLDVSFNTTCNNKECEAVDATKYQSSIGSLMHIAICTRPDIMHSVVKLAQRNNDPHKEHETAIKHILRYLKKTVDFKLVYQQTGESLKGYADADWGSDPSNRKSYSGYAFFLGGGVFSWSSQRQKCVALSSTEAEYIALTDATKEAVYLKGLLSELGVQESKDPVTIFGDNLSAQQLVKNPEVFRNAHSSAATKLDVQVQACPGLYGSGSEHSFS
ncbi:uncharacterized protein [Musca autumnalis]|uniref:uncharacterized protein n=1 Tax=Musca autumnalis TaxID=221902 RepID=UPI003CF59374